MQRSSRNAHMKTQTRFPIATPTPISWKAHNAKSQHQRKTHQHRQWETTQACLSHHNNTSVGIPQFMPETHGPKQRRSEAAQCLGQRHVQHGAHHCPARVCVPGRQVCSQPGRRRKTRHKNSKQAETQRQQFPEVRIRRLVVLLEQENRDKNVSKFIFGMLKILWLKSVNQISAATLCPLKFSVPLKHSQAHSSTSAHIVKITTCFPLRPSNFLHVAGGPEVLLFRLTSHSCLLSHL